MSDVLLVRKDELYHHGVKGMKWGHRKRPEVVTAKQNYKSARKDYRTAARTSNKAARKAIGIKGIQNANTAQNKARKAEMKAIDAKVEYNKSKARNEKASERAEFRTYKKEMKKTGIRGSYNDINSGNRSTAVYNHIRAQKGKAYADKIEKRIQNEAYATIATAVTVGVGHAFVSAYFQNK